MTLVLDGLQLAQQIRSEVAAGIEAVVARSGRPPGLAAVLVGEDPASHVYVGSKEKACQETGIRSRVLRLPAATSEAELERLIDELNAAVDIDGILVQLPLPAHLKARHLLDRIDPSKDVDGFHPVSVGRLWLDERTFPSATPAGIRELLKRNGIAIAGRRAVIVGRSSIVGKPMAALLLADNATVTVCHSKTVDLPAVCREADILVAAIGRAGMIGPEHVREGAVVIDVGMNRITDRALGERLLAGAPKRLAAMAERGSALVGDVDYYAVAPRASAITPVPGGVGPLTVAMLMVNTLTAARRRTGLEPG